MHKDKHLWLLHTLLWWVLTLLAPPQVADPNTQAAYSREQSARKGVPISWSPDEWQDPQTTEVDLEAIHQEIARALSARSPVLLSTPAPSTRHICAATAYMRKRQAGEVPSLFEMAEQDFIDLADVGTHVTQRLPRLSGERLAQEQREWEQQRRRRREK